MEYVKPDGCINLVGGIKDGDRLAALPEIKDLNALRRANFCGIPSQGIVEKTASQHGKPLYLTGHRGTSRRHFEEAIKNLRDHGQLFIKVVSHIVSLETAASLFNRIAEGPMHEFNEVTYVKAIVDVQLAGRVIKNV
jgi:threonine dehydrogenase-like Zn-dependent dehydrogenase